MYTKAENGINYNRMKGVKDSTKQDVKVQLYCAYIKGESNASDGVIDNSFISCLCGSEC